MTTTATATFSQVLGLERAVLYLAKAVLRRSDIGHRLQTATHSGYVLHHGRSGCQRLLQRQCMQLPKTEGCHSEGGATGNSSYRAGRNAGRLRGVLSAIASSAICLAKGAIDGEEAKTTRVDEVDGVRTHVEA